MKIRVPRILAAGAVAVLALCARAGGEETLTKGVILGSQDVQIGTSGKNRVLTIHREDGTQTFADLGPSENFKGVKMPRGKMITLEGTPVRMSDSDVVFARRVVLGGKTYTMTRNDLPDLTKVSAKSMNGAFAAPPNATEVSAVDAAPMATGLAVGAAPAPTHAASARIIPARCAECSAKTAAGATIPTRVLARGMDMDAGASALTQVDAYSFGGSGMAGIRPVAIPPEASCPAPASDYEPAAPGTAYLVHPPPVASIRPAVCRTRPTSGRITTGATITPGLAGFMKVPAPAYGYGYDSRRDYPYAGGTAGMNADSHGPRNFSFPVYAGSYYGGPTGTGSAYSGGTGLGNSYSSSAGVGASMGGRRAGTPYDSPGLGSDYGYTAPSRGSSSRWWTTTPSPAGNMEMNLSRADAVGSVTAVSSSSFASSSGNEWGERSGSGSGIRLASAYPGYGYGTSPAPEVTSGIRDISGGGFVDISGSPCGARLAGSPCATRVIAGSNCPPRAPRVASVACPPRPISEPVCAPRARRVAIAPVRAACSTCTTKVITASACPPKVVSVSAPAPASCAPCAARAAGTSSEMASTGSTMAPRSGPMGGDNQVVTVDTNYGPVVTTVGAAKDLNRLTSTEGRPIRVNAVSGNVAAVTALGAGERPAVTWVDGQGRTSVRSTLAPNLVDRPYDAWRFNQLTVGGFCSGPGASPQVCAGAASDGSAQISNDASAESGSALTPTSSATGSTRMGARGIDLPTRYTKSATSAAEPVAAAPPCATCPDAAAKIATGRVPTGGAMDRTAKAEPCDAHETTIVVAAPAASPASGSASDASASGEIEIIASEYKFEPNRIEARAGQPIRVTFRNMGSRAHAIDFRLSGETLALPQSLASGDARALTFNAPMKPGAYTFYCPVGSHAELGMKGTLIVR